MRKLWPWLRTLLGAGILVVLGWWLGTDAFVAGLRTVDPQALVTALAIGTFTTVLSAYRWRVIAQRIGLALPLPAAIADYYRALLLNAVLPAGVLGDVDRGVRHGRRTGQLARGVHAVALERLAGQVVLGTVAAAVLLAHPAVLAVVADHLDPLLLLSVVAGLSCVAVLFTWARLRTARVRDAVRSGLHDARAALLSRGTWPRIALLSLAVLLGHLTLFVVAARTAGVSAPVTQLALLGLMALLAMAVPTNVGGWGPREAGCALIFAATGLGAAQGLATAVVYGVLALVASLPGAVVLLRAPAQRLSTATNAFASRRRCRAERSQPASLGIGSPVAARGLDDRREVAEPPGRQLRCGSSTGSAMTSTSAPLRSTVSGSGRPMASANISRASP